MNLDRLNKIILTVENENKDPTALLISNIFKQIFGTIYELEAKIAALETERDCLVEHNGSLVKAVQERDEWLKTKPVHHRSSREVEAIVTRLNRLQEWIKRTPAALDKAVKDTEELIKDGERIQAIKWRRDYTGENLQTCRDYVQNLRKELIEKGEIEELEEGAGPHNKATKQ